MIELLSFSLASITYNRKLKCVDVLIVDMLEIAESLHYPFLFLTRRYIWVTFLAIVSYISTLIYSYLHIYFNLEKFSAKNKFYMKSLIPHNSFTFL